MYRIYAQNKKTGWEKIDVTNDKEEAFKTASKISSKEYYSYMIIESNHNGDGVIARKSLYKECQVEYVDEVKTEYEVKATTFKPSKTKRKQEERRFFEDYFNGRSRDYGEDDYLNY